MMLEPIYKWLILLYSQQKMLSKTLQESLHLFHFQK